MRYQCEYPFVGFYTKHFHSGEGRYRIVINKRTPSEKHMNYARYLMCVHLGRILEEHEQVHHKDDCKTNDVIENLEILSDVDHGKLHHDDKTFVDLVCCNCRKKFTRQMKEHTQAIKFGWKSFCSRSCNASFRNATKRRIKLSFV